MAVNDRKASGVSGGAERDLRLERLYREAAREVPPEHLDAAVRAAAHREVGARPRSLSAALRRWHLPISIAAVVVVGVSLVILMEEEGGDRVGEARMPPPSASADKPPAQSTQAPPAADAKAAAQMQVEAPAPGELRESREDAKHSASKAAGKASREIGPTVAPHAGITRVQEPVAESLSKPLELSPPQLVRERAAAPAPPDTAASDRAETASPAPDEQRSAVPAADMPQGKPMARAILAKPAAVDRPPVWQGMEKELPEKWLARIEELTREGRATEAEEMRNEFKRRFPDHPLGRASK